VLALCMCDVWVFQRELEKERNHEKIFWSIPLCLFWFFYFETNTFSGFVDLTFVSTSSITFWDGHQRNSFTLKPQNQLFLLWSQKFWFTNEVQNLSYRYFRENFSLKDLHMAVEWDAFSCWLKCLSYWEDIVKSPHKYWICLLG